MKQSSIAIIIYMIGVIIEALFLDIWDAETSIKKGINSTGLDYSFNDCTFLCR